MTLNEIAYNLLNLVRGGRSHHDEHISLDQIKFNIKHYRAVFIRRDYQKNGFRSRHTEQDLGCIRLERVNASKCCGLPAPSCVYRTVQPIPKTIRYNFSEAITHVGDISGVGRIPMVESNVIKFLSYDKYTKGKYKAFMIEDYMYIHNADGLEFINIRGVFEDPEEVSRFGDCADGGCYEGDKSHFPIPLDMIQTINQGILGGELKLLASSASDTENDRMQDPQTIMRASNKQK
tara:strand:+ start:752 stop:1453 length:702 start_codon:yes stop_codon:yes gene_type:complete